MVRSLFFCAGVVFAGMAMAQVNVAASANGGVARQISDYSGGSTAEKAIDGNRDGRWGTQSIQHTSSHLNAWWEVVFAETSTIDIVNIWNRIDCCQDRINPFTVFLFDDQDTIVWSVTGQTFQNTISDGDGNTSGMEFVIGGVDAKRLRVQLDDTNYLHMAEVEAFGEPVPEPLSLAVLAGGGLLALRRRKK